MSGETKYRTTFHFYYEVVDDACADYKMMRKELAEHEIKLDYAFKEGGKKYWYINIIMVGLTAKQVIMHDCAMKLKFRYYDGWDVDTKDPHQTIKDFGYIAKDGKAKKWA